MTVELDAIKSLAVDGVELKKLYANNQLVWKRASAWRRQLDLYPRAVRNDGEGNLYVLASSKVQSTGKPDQLKMIKLTSDGEIIFSIDLKKLETNADYSQKGFVIVDGYIYISIYEYVFQLNAIDGTLVKKVALKNDGFVHTEKIGNDIVLMTPDDGMISTYESFSIPTLVVKKNGYFGHDVIDSKVYKNVLYILSNIYQALFYVDGNFKTNKVVSDIPGSPYVLEIDDTYFYVCNGYDLMKYDKVTKKLIWQTSAPGSATGSLFIVDDRIILESRGGFFIYEKTKGELVFSKPKTSALPELSNKLLANIEDRYFCRLAYDEKAVYKLELGDEDNYENLN